MTGKMPVLLVLITALVFYATATLRSDEKKMLRVFEGVLGICANFVLSRM